MTPFPVPDPDHIENANGSSVGRDLQGVDDVDALLPDRMQLPRDALR